jgi:hypothetical protein
MERGSRNDHDGRGPEAEDVVSLDHANVKMEETRESNTTRRHAPSSGA